MKQDIKSLATITGISPAAAPAAPAWIKDIDHAINSLADMLKLVVKAKETFGPPPVIEAVVKDHPSIRAKGNDSLGQVLSMVNALGLGNVPLEQIWLRLKDKTVNQLVGKS